MSSATGELIRVFEGHSGGVSCVAFAPSGTVLVTGSGDATARLWEVATGRLLSTLSGHTEGLSSVAFSPDSTIVVVSFLGRGRAGGCTPEQYVLVLDRGKRGARAWRLPFLAVPHLSPPSFQSGSRDSSVRLWAVATGAQLLALTGHHEGVSSVAFSPDGHMIASGSGDKTLRLWDSSSGEILHSYDDHTGRVTAVVFLPSGTMLASGSWDGTVRLWSARGASLRVYEGHQRVVDSVACSPDGLTLASGSHDRTVRLWSVEHGTALRVLEGHTGSVYGVAFR